MSEKPDDIVLHPEIPGSRYVINKTMAWLCLFCMAVLGFMFGFLIALIVLF